MPISLPPELEAFTHRQIKAGNYGSIEELGREVQIGVDALDRGESQDLDTAIDGLRQKMRQKYGA